MSTTRAGLATIGHIDIPAAVLKHRFAVEALACARLYEKKNDPVSQVVGTENTRQCELYGWRSNVDSHADATGWIYLVPLNRAVSTICAYSRIGKSKHTITVAAHQGDVIRMFDYLTHWTMFERSPRVAAFVGSWPEPADSDALSLLSDGIGKLAAGDYYGAPRVRAGFRAPLEDECYVDADVDGNLTMMLVADARKQDRLILTCAHCDRRAVSIDNHYPYFSDQSRCENHLDMPEAA